MTDHTAPDDIVPATPAAPSEASGAVSGAGAPRTPPAPPLRKRPKPGERRVQILQTLAPLVEQPGSDRVTTAALAARLEVSEAALYRHFASKAQMFEGLIDFIEASLFTLINQIAEREASGAVQAHRIAAVVLQFGERNAGMARVMVGDALVFEHERLLTRINQLFERIEGQLRGSLRLAAEASGSLAPTVDANARASVLCAFIVGRLQRFARSNFKRMPTEFMDRALELIVGPA